MKKTAARCKLTGLSCSELALTSYPLGIHVTAKIQLLGEDGPTAQVELHGLAASQTIREKAQALLEIIEQEALGHFFEGNETHDENSPRGTTVSREAFQGLFGTQLPSPNTPGGLEKF